MDYLFRWLEQKFITGQQQFLFPELKAAPAEVEPQESAAAPQLRAKSQEPRAGAVHASDALKDLVDMGDAPSCHVCGAIMTRNGSCFRCMSCGSTSGCS
jgi:ribonucleoside-diphosphate reductase alpha chain